MKEREQMANYGMGHDDPDRKLAPPIDPANRPELPDPTENQYTDSDPDCTICGRDNRNGTHDALELTRHLSHTFTTGPQGLEFPCSVCKNVFVLKNGVIPLHYRGNAHNACPGAGRVPFEDHTHNDPIPSDGVHNEEPPKIQGGSYRYNGDVVQVQGLKAGESIPEGERVMVGGGQNVTVQGNTVTWSPDTRRLLDMMDQDSDVARKTYDTGAIREIKEERFDLIPTEPIRLLAIHYARGALKYAERNWEKGFPWSNPYNSARRHLDAYIDGEDVDPDTGSLHLVAALWNIIALIEFQQTHPELDDRKGKTDEH